MDLQGLEFDILESILEDRRLMDLIDEVSGSEGRQAVRLDHHLRVTHPFGTIASALMVYIAILDDQVTLSFCG